MSRTAKCAPNQIRSFRLRRNLRLRDVAYLLGYGAIGDVWRWEKGIKTPSLDNALKLSIALQCPVEVLFLERFHELRAEMRPRIKYPKYKLGFKQPPFNN